jgi:hypothetical protein
MASDWPKMALKTDMGRSNPPKGAQVSDLKI